jgi:hypothetical protein
LNVGRQPFWFASLHRGDGRRVILGTQGRCLRRGVGRRKQSLRNGQEGVQGDSIPRVQLQDLKQELFQLSRDDDLRWDADVSRADVHEELSRVLSLERGRPNEHFKDNTTQRPEVGLHIVLLHLKDFRCLVTVVRRGEEGGQVVSDHVQGCATRCLSHRCFNKMLRKPEIGVFDDGVIGALTEEKILRLDVAMDDIFAVEEAQSFGCREER